MAENPPLLPGQVNEHGQLTDQDLLRKNRKVFLGGNVLIQALWTGIGMGIPTKVIRAFGGGDQHLGLFGAIGGLGSLFHFVGALILRLTESDRRGIRLVLGLNSAVLLLVALSVLMAYLPSGRIWGLYLFLFLWVCATIIYAGIGNINTNWTGDLVPRERLGWFVSAISIAVNITVLVLSLLAGKFGDLFPNPGGYASVYLMLAAVFFIALPVFGRGMDRTPKNLNFFGHRDPAHGRLDYGSLALWCYIAFYSLWACGRAILFTFSTVFLLEEFHFSLTRIAWLGSIQLVVGVAALYLFGRISDKKGNWILLVLVSGAVALSMYLWVSTAWIGIAPVFVFMIVNGAAGAAHGMLGVNFGLEIFPDRGRAAYVAFSRFFIGVMAFVGPVVAGWVLRLYGEAQVTVFGKVLTKYYLTFATGATITLLCVIPLLIMGKRKV